MNLRVRGSEFSKEKLFKIYKKTKSKHGGIVDSLLIDFWSIWRPFWGGISKTNRFKNHRNRDVKKVGVKMAQEPSKRGNIGIDRRSADAHPGTSGRPRAAGERVWENGNKITTQDLSMKMLANMCAWKATRNNVRLGHYQLSCTSRNLLGKTYTRRTTSYTVHRYIQEITI